MAEPGTGNYERTYAAAKDDPEGFWGQVAEGVDWIKPWDKVVDDSRKPFYRWFTGGRLNPCYNAIDTHVIAGRGDQPVDGVLQLPVEHLPVGDHEDGVEHLLPGAAVERGEAVRRPGDRVRLP